MDPNTGLDSELDSFRQKWLSDLKGKTKSPSQHPTQNSPGSTSKIAKTKSQSGPVPPAPSLSGKLPENEEENVEEPDEEHDEEDFIPQRAFDDPQAAEGHRLTDPPSQSSGDTGPVSALDHFEEAMEKEAQGNMGDSLLLYRRAYRLDGGVDRAYREKHLPQPSSSSSASKTTATTIAPSTTAATATPMTITSEPQPPPAEPSTPKPLSTKALIASFSTLTIQPAVPTVQGGPPPPCPIASLPAEILVHILHDVGTDDIADFVRLAQVCKRLAYLVSTEKRIWRRICIGEKFGFAGMHHQYQRAVDWKPLDDDDEVGEQRTVEDQHGVVTTIIISPRELTEQRRSEKLLATLSLTPTPTYPTWRDMFRHRPRVRFNGCYISTVNYARPGQASTNQATWGGAPIHIVTYYRYLRFFRDGTAISLLSTDGPTEVVHYLTKDLLDHHRGGQHNYLPSAVMSQALKGRWRVSSASASSAAEGDEEEGLVAKREGDVYVETEGIGSKYFYRMDLSFKSAGKGAKNNKLIWRGFWSYNKLTDDWGVFGLKNDKQFIFSRVKSYGYGE